jgi:hypothetical protein
VIPACVLVRVQVPFSLSCGMPGRLRWVTTNIARFDPLVEWPSDLACNFTWNKGLKSFDGAHQGCSLSINSSAGLAWLQGVKSAQNPAQHDSSVARQLNSCALQDSSVLAVVGA